MKKFSCAEYNRKLKNDAIDNLKAVDYDVNGNRLYKVSLNEKVRYNQFTGDINQHKFYFQNYSLTAESLEEKLAFGHPIAFCHLKTFENSIHPICKPSNWMQSRSESVV